MIAKIASITVEKAKNECLTIKSRRSNGTTCYLHSSYDPLFEGRIWADSIQIQEETAYFILGFGLGYHVKELLLKLPASSVVYVLEKPGSLDFPTLAKQLLPGESWLQDDRLYFVYDESIRNLAGVLYERMRKQKIRRITLCKYYPAMQFQSEFYQKIENELISKIEEIFYVNLTFNIKTGQILQKNLWRNIPYISSNPGIDNLKNSFKDFPAIVIASGPSLIKNVGLLKKCKGKAVIIAVSSAIGVLDKFEIIPDFIVVADPYENDRVRNIIKHSKYNKTVLLALYDSYYKQLRDFPGMRCFCTRTSEALNHELSKILPKTAPMRAGSSVATLGLDFAYHLGANPIIMVGQDLAFGEAVGCGDGTIQQYKYSSEGSATDAVLSVPVAECTKVKGYFGREVITNHFFCEVLDSLTLLIRTMQGRTIINATEGGAFIEGAVHISLRETIKQYLRKEKEITGRIIRLYNEFCREDWMLIEEKLQSIKEDVRRFIDCQEQSLENFEKYNQTIQECFFYKYIQPYIESLQEMYWYALGNGDMNAVEELVVVYTKNIIHDLAEHIEESIAICKEIKESETGL